MCCCWYHKGTNFQANHNSTLVLRMYLPVVADTTKVRIFKQITTICFVASKFQRLLLIPQRYEFSSKSQRANVDKPASNGCCWYHKGTNFQANHNWRTYVNFHLLLLLIPQRYEFSSKSQPVYDNANLAYSCCWYHKGTNFQANHNNPLTNKRAPIVVADTTKVRIFKQITTARASWLCAFMLLLIPQRYEFSSKSQQQADVVKKESCCCWYHKGTNFQANHNSWRKWFRWGNVVADTTKVRIFKQITTTRYSCMFLFSLLLIPQRYEFSSKSQHCWYTYETDFGCCWYHKGTNFQANHNRSVSWLCCWHVVADTTKVRIFKQITTNWFQACTSSLLLLIPQRYEFSSKSQPEKSPIFVKNRCCWYHKGTNFQANHNTYLPK